GEFELALTDDPAQPQQQPRTLLYCGPLPALKCLQSGAHRRFHLFPSRLLEHSHYLRRPRRIDGSYLLAGLQSLAGDHQVVLPAQLGAHFLDRLAHPARVLFFAEIYRWFVAESLESAAHSGTADRLHRCHKASLLPGLENCSARSRAKIPTLDFTRT